MHLSTFFSEVDFVFHYDNIYIIFLLNRGLKQLVASQTADSGVLSSILAWFHTFMEFDLEIISTGFLLLSTDSRRVDVSYERKCEQEVLVNRFVNLAQEKMWLVELTVST